MHDGQSGIRALGREGGIDCVLDLFKALKAHGIGLISRYVSGGEPNLGSRADQGNGQCRGSANSILDRVALEQFLNRAIIIAQQVLELSMLPHALVARRGENDDTSIPDGKIGGVQGLARLPEIDIAWIGASQNNIRRAR